MYSISHRPYLFDLVEFTVAFSGCSIACVPKVNSPTSKLTFRSVVWGIYRATIISVVIALGALARLDQDEEPSGAGGEAGSRRTLGAVMPASFSVDDPAHWRGRAEEARTLAKEMKDKILRQMMLKIAEGYKRLAKHAKKGAKKRYFARDVRSWDEFVRIVSGHKGRWVYRGQPKEWPLQSSLEKYIRAWDSNIALSPMIERQMLRDFRRRYPDQADAAVHEDTLYCLAMMQHHLAPTRLMDWTYSPF